MTFFIVGRHISRQFSILINWVDKVISGRYDLPIRKTDERESTSGDTDKASCGRWERSAGNRVECTREGKLNGFGSVGEDGMIRRYHGSAHNGAHEWTLMRQAGWNRRSLALVPAKNLAGARVFLRP